VFRPAFLSDTLHLDEHQRTIWRNRQQINTTIEAGRRLLTPDQHPLLREQERGGDDHVFEQLLTGEKRFSQCLRPAGNFPEGGAKGVKPAPSKT
jgi:hypothetical protein